MDDKRGSTSASEGLSITFSMFTDDRSSTVQYVRGFLLLVVRVQEGENVSGEVGVNSLPLRLVQVKFVFKDIFG